MMRKILGCALAVITAAGATAVAATETVTYSYDAQGRLTNVGHTGTVNNNLTTSYVLDKADNRTGVAITGAAH